MFWGFILEPKKRYNTTVSKGFHISMAALDPKSVNENDITSVVLTFDGTDTILCNLGRPNLLQERLDLNFVEGDTITLEAKGKACVHLSGYFIAYEDYPKDMSDLEDDSDLDEEEEEDDDEEDDKNFDKNALKALKSKFKKQKSAKEKKAYAAQEEEDSDEDDEEDDSDDESMGVSDLTFDDEEDSDEEEDEEEGGDEDEEEEEAEVKMGSPGSTPMPPKKKNKSSQNSTPVSTNKQSKRASASNEEIPLYTGPKKKSPQQQQQKPVTNGTSTPGSNKKKKNKDGSGTPNNTPNSNSKQQQNEGNKGTPRKSLEGGVIVEDLKVGQGVPAKSGKMVSVYYVGKLKNNNKQFDSTTQGSGFKFRLGKGEVIKGWDVGLNGMKVGGKRRITIPSHMAYGNKGSPPAIPPNSTLVFDVELKNVN